jgi:uncharacterized protein involved in outer membrane biogenesis
MSNSKKLLIAAGVIVGLPLITLAVLPFIVDANRFRPLVQDQLRQRLQSPVSIGNMQLKTFPLSIRVSDLVIGQPAGLATLPPMLSVKEASVGVAFVPLLMRELKIGAVRLVSPRIELVRGVSGAWNYAAGGASSRGGQNSGTLTLDEFTIQDGQIAITDLMQKKPRDVYEHIDLDLKGPDANQRGSVTGSMRLNTMAAVLQIRSDFDIGPAAAAKGALTLTADRTKDPLNVDFDVARPNAASPLNIKTLEAKIGALSASATGFINLQQTPIGLALHVKTKSAPIGEITRLAALFGATFPPDLKVDGNLQADLDITGNTDKPQLAGNIEATQAVIRSKELVEPVSASQLAVKLTPDSLETRPFTLQTGNTKLTAQVTATGYSGPTPQVSATLQTTGARVEELLRMATAYGVKPAGLSGSGAVNLDMKIRQSGKTLAYSGTGSLKGVSLTSPALPGPLTVANADIKFSDDRVGLDALQAALNNMHLTGSLSAKDFAHPDLQFNLHVDQVNLDELSKMRTTTSSPAAAKQQPPALNNISANGAIAIDKVLYEQSTITNLKASVDLRGGVLKLDPVTAGLFGGQESGSITADLRKAVAAYEVKSKLTNVETSQLLAATSSVKNVSGPLSGDADLTFFTRPNENIAASLNGSMRMQMGPGKISGVQILNQIASIGKFGGFTGKQEAYTNINKMTGTLNIRNGAAATNDLLLDLKGATMTAAGTMGLVDQTLTMSVVTTITREYAQKTMPGSIGGMLSTVLASPKGDLVIPALVSGTFAQPRFAPDPEAIVKLKLKGLTGGSGVQGLVDAITGKQPTGATGQAGGLGDLLNRFQKKK